MEQQDWPDNPPLTEESEEFESSQNEMASKLSKELSNWRRRRSVGRSRQADGPLAISKAQLSEPARTIKVRGHETLVIRKSKLAPKPRTDGRN